MSDLTVREITTARDRDRFLRLPHRLYRDDPHWISPLLIEQRQRLDRHKNPYFQHADAALFVAERDGQVVGTISAQVCQIARRRHGEPTGHFGYFESQNDDAIAGRLIDAAKTWLTGRGASMMVGPLNLSINDEAGILVDGFDTPPYVFMGHHHRYYDALLQCNGMQPVMDMHAYYMDLREPYPDRMRRIIDRTRRDPAITIENIPRKNMVTQLGPVLQLFNDAWDDNWGHVPLTPAEVDHLVRSVTQLLDDDSVIVAKIDGRVAGFIVVIPNLCQWTGDLGGRLWPTGWIKLLSRMRFATARSIRVPLMGVRKDLQTSRAGATVAMSMIDHCKTRYRDRGVHTAELSWILQTNTPMRSILDGLGATSGKVYRMYDQRW